MTSTPESISVSGVAVARQRRAGKPSSVLVRHITQWLLLALLGFCSYLLVSHFLVQSVRIVGFSMVPTLNDSDHYLLNRWVYHVRAPRRGEIVVVRDPTDGTLAVKRIVAGPGENLVLRAGSVYLNGALLSEPYLPAHTWTFNAGPGREQAVHCGREQYFVMGDNRMNSLDSRCYGPISQAGILGLVIH